MSLLSLLRELPFDEAGKLSIAAYHGSFIHASIEVKVILYDIPIWVLDSIVDLLFLFSFPISALVVALSVPRRCLLVPETVPWSHY